MLRTTELRREEEEQRVMNARRIDQWLTRRREQMELAKPKAELQNLIFHNLTKRGPLKLAKRKSQAPSPLPSQVWEESESPYMSPSPVWRVRSPISARSTKLPPLTDSFATMVEREPGLDTEMSRSFPGASNNMPPSTAQCQTDEHRLSQAEVNAGLHYQNAASMRDSGGAKKDGQVKILECGRRRSSGSEKWDSRRQSAQSTLSSDEGELPETLRDELSAITGSLSRSIVLNRRNTVKTQGRS